MERGARRGVSKQGSSTPGAVAGAVVEEASSRAAVLLLHHRPFFQGTPVSKQQALEYTPAMFADLVVSSRLVSSFPSFRSPARAQLTVVFYPSIL